MKKILLPLLACVLATTAKADVVDVLNQEVTGVTGTTYTDFTNKTATSKAVYAGQCAGSNGSIQLRTKNSTEGVVSTTSGGKVKQVVIEWNPSTAYPTADKPEQTRTVLVYASNTAYTSAANLFDAELQGTQVGEVTYDGETSTATITIDGDYTYVGFRSQNAALYLNSVSITWDGEAGGGGDNPPAVTVEAPTFSPDGGYYANTVTVALAQADGLTIHYTTDESTPTAESAVYSAPITLTATESSVKTIIKAIAIDTNGNVSDIASATYTVVPVAPMTIGEGQAGFDFVMNPWGITLATSNTGTDGIVESLTASDNATTLKVDKGTANYNTYLYSYSAAGQLRIYKGASFTIKAPAGKYISNVVFDFANTSSTLTEGEGTYNSANAEWAATPALSQVTFTVTANSQIKTILVTLANEGTDVDDGGGEEPEPKPSIVNTPETAYTPAQANAYANEGYTESVYVKGFITSVKSLNPTKYTNAQYYIGETVDATETFYVYNGKYLDGADFTSEDQIKVGDEVIVYGKLTVYKGTPEFEAGNYIYSLQRTGEPQSDIAAPTFSLESGSYSTAQELTITGPEGYGIIYTTDGTTPEDGNGVYVTDNTVTVSMAETTTVKAIAVDNDDPDFTSNVVSVTITITPTYTTIAALKAATTATSASEYVNFTFENLVVTGAAGSYVYVTDGTEGYLFYGRNSGMEKGDIISGTISGQPYKYNGLNEMSVQEAQWANVAKSENKAEVAAVEVKIADVITEEGMAKYENMYIRLTDVTFKAGAINRSDALVQDENELTIYNTLNDATISALTFSTTQLYNVNVYLAIRNGAAQVYPLSADFFDAQTELADAESSWNIADNIYYSKPTQEADNFAFTTKSDATPEFASSNDKVATVDAQGNVTFVGAGIATITATTAETATYMPSTTTLYLYILSDAEGTEANPYTPADVQILYTMNDVPEGSVWVKGTIAGNVNTSKGFTVVPETADDAANTNLSLDIDGTNIAVQLPAGDVRTALNLKDNFDLLGKEVLIYGTIEKYCGVAGLKNVTDAILDGVSVGIDGIASEASAPKAIYTLSGQKVRAITRGGIYIVDGKKTYVK